MFFGPVYPALAKQYGVTLYPFFLDGIVANPKYLLADGLHPNDAGYEVMGPLAEKAIATALAK